MLLLPQKLPDDYSSNLLKSLNHLKENIEQEVGENMQLLRPSNKNNPISLLKGFSESSNTNNKSEFNLKPIDYFNLS